MLGRPALRPAAGLYAARALRSQAVLLPVRAAAVGTRRAGYRSCCRAAGAAGPLAEQPGGDGGLHHSLVKHGLGFGTAARSSYYSGHETCESASCSELALG